MRRRVYTTRCPCEQSVLFNIHRHFASGISLVRLRYRKRNNLQQRVGRTDGNMASSEPIFQRNLTRIVTAAKHSEFSVVSYNILCDGVFETNPSLYSYLPNEMKKRGPVPKNSVRHTQLIKEVSHLYFYYRELIWLVAAVAMIFDMSARSLPRCE